MKLILELFTEDEGIEIWRKNKDEFIVEKFGDNRLSLDITNITKKELLNYLKKI